MARKDLAGLAALGALGYMLSRDSKPTEVENRTGSSTASTGMGEATQLLTPDNSSGKDYGGSSGTGDYAPGPSSMMRPEPVSKPRPRPRPMAAAPVAAPPAVVSDAQRQYDEANARARTPEGRAERARMESSQALEAVRPEEAMIGGGGLKTVAAMARGLANRRGAEKLAEYSVPRIGTEPLKIGTEPLKMTGPSKAELVARDRAARTAGREAERKEFNQRGRDRFVESTFEGGMKRGGKVKKMASGGMARSSASSRADGIASRGKTRGKVC
jgi:hypothetical protein